MKSPNRPTPEQSEWLKNNYRLYNNDHLAERLNIPVSRLTHWLRLLDLRKQKVVRKIGEVKARPKLVNPGPEKKMKHPPADHTNISREQHVERILNMEMPNT